MRKLKVAMLGWEPPSKSRVLTGAGMYLRYLSELGKFARARGRKLSLTFIVPSEQDRLVHRDGYRELFVRTRGFCEHRRYDADILYPAAKKFSERLLSRRGSVDLKKFDVILANSFAFGELISRAKLENLVYISHRPEFLREKFAKRFGIRMAGKSRLLRDSRLETKAIGNSRRAITVSKACKRELSQRFNRSRIDVIYNGVDTNLFSRVWCKPNGKTVFTYAGRNHPEKGVGLLLQGIQRVVERGCSNFELRLLTDDGESLRRSVNRMGLSKQVKLMGWRRLRELPRYYSASTFTIMPSYWESFSYATAEGLACEVPVIASTAGALPEMVDGEIGLRFRAGSERELADQLEEANNFDPESLAEMGRRGRIRIKQRFSKKTFLDNYLRYLEQLTDGTLGNRS